MERAELMETSHGARARPRSKGGLVRDDQGRPLGLDEIAIKLVSRGTPTRDKVNAALASLA